MSYKITKVSDSDFYINDIKKYSNMGASMMVGPEGGSGSSDYSSIYYDTDYKLYIEDSKASSVMGDINSEINKLKSKFNKTKILSDKELDALKRYTYDYWMIFYWNKYKNRMNDKEFSRGMENRAKMAMNQVNFQNTLGPGINLSGSEEIISIMKDTVKGIAMSYPVTAHAISLAVIVENLTKARTFILKTLTGLKDSNNPELKSIGEAFLANKDSALMGIDLSKVFNDSDANISDFVGYIVNIAIASLAFVSAGNPAGAALNTALSAGKSSIQRAILGSLNGVYALIKAIASSKNLSKDGIKLFSMIWKIVGGPIGELLRGAEAA